MSLYTENHVWVFADKFFLGHRSLAQLWCCWVSLDAQAKGEHWSYGKDALLAFQLIVVV